jgi:hypothetical protein
MEKKLTWDFRIRRSYGDISKTDLGGTYGYNLRHFSDYYYRPSIL